MVAASSASVVKLGFGQEHASHRSVPRFRQIRRKPTNSDVVISHTCGAIRRRTQSACLVAARNARIRLESDVSPRTATARAEAERKQAIWKPPQFLQPILRLRYETRCSTNREACDRAVGNSSLACGPVLRA